MKILLIRLSSTGDIILVAPVIRFLRHNISGCRVDLLVKQGFEQAAGLIKPDKILKLKIFSHFVEDISSIKKIIKQINDEKYDMVIDLHSNFRTFIIMLFIKARIKITYKKDILKRRLMVIFKWFLKKYKSVEEKYLDAVKIALQRTGIKKIKEPENINKKVKKINSIVIHAGAKWGLKRWPYFFELIQVLLKRKGIKIFITGLKEEIEKNNKLLYIKGAGIFNLIGKTDFARLASVIKNADLFIGNDTVAAHIARLYNIPAIVILGPTVPEFGFINYRNFYVIEKKLACRPCDLHGKGRCPIGTFECMKEIKPEMIVEKLNKLKR